VVSWYIILDITFLVLLGYFSKIAYEKKYYIKFFEYFKIFVTIYIASKLAPFTGLTLQNLYIIKADTYITLIIISFSLNVVLIFYFWKNLVKATNNFLSTNKMKIFFAKVLSVLEVSIILTLFLYLIMQIYIVKVNLHQTLDKTYTYTIVSNFYHKFLNKDILAILQGSNTGTNQKEILFKSFSNSI
jgi:hypothetical protein